MREITRLSTVVALAFALYAPGPQVRAQDPTGDPTGDPTSEEKEAPLPPSLQTPRFDAKTFREWLSKQTPTKAAKAAVLLFDKDLELGSDSRLTDRVLRMVHSDYAAAMSLRDDGDPKGALELAKVLADAKDPVVRGHARFFLAKTLLDEDDPEGASELFRDFIREDRGHSVLDPEAAFYFGYGLALIPRVDQAIVNLQLFLELYPKAPERYRANAQQLLQELEAQWQSPLHAIADDMKYCERRLRKDRIGDPVETKQLDIIEKLQQLIEELEKQEQQGGGGPPSGNQVPNGPASNSSLPGGEGRVGRLHGSRGVKDRWGDMKDRDRKKILNELQTKLPERYRRLLESYYKRVNR